MFAVCTTWLAVGAFAEPVQWREEDGGNGLYYEYVPEALSWPDAKQAAAKRSHRGTPGRLIVIISKEHNAFAKSLLPDKQAKAWIGLSDLKEEGVFAWVDGSALDYTNWAGGEPNNAGEEDCVEMRSDGTWNDKEAEPPAKDNPPSGYFVEYDAEHHLAFAEGKTGNAEKRNG